jgi:hypothetical protein
MADLPADVGRVESSEELAEGAFRKCVMLVIAYLLAQIGLVKQEA